MLDIFRRNKKSIFGIVIIGFCALLMVPFGIDMINTQNVSQAAVVVDGDEISMFEYYRRLEGWQNLFRNQFGESYSSVQSMLNLEQRTVDDLIQGALVDELADSVGLAASVTQVEQQIASHPFFQGGITKASYEQFLRAQGLTGAGLQQMTQKQLIAGQLSDILSDLSTSTDAELRWLYQDQNRKKSFNFVVFDPAKFQDQVDVSDQKVLEDYYAANAERFKVPRAIRFSAVAFTAGEYEPKVDLLEEDLRGMYEQQQELLYEPNQVKLRRILIKKPAEDKSALESMLGQSAEEANRQSVVSPQQEARNRAEEVYARLDAGEDFAALAKEVSEDEETKASGGDLGWLRYQILKGPVRRDASRLDPGEYSGVLDTDLGFEIIYVEDKRERRKKAFDEVRGELERQLRQDMAPEYARAAAEEFSLSLNEQAGKTSLSEFAKEQGRTVIETPGLLKRGDSAPGIPADLLTKAATLVEGDREVFVVGNSSYVVEIAEVKEAHLPEFPEIKDKVVEMYKREKSVDLAKAKAEEALAKLQALSPEETGRLAKVAGEYGLEPQSTQPGTRTTAAGPLFNSPDVRRAAFALSAGNPVSDQVHNVNGQFFLVELASVEEPPPYEQAEQKPLRSTEMDTAGRRLTQALLDVLKANSEVWVNPEIFGNSEQV